MKLPWTKQYEPKKISEVIGQSIALREVVSFINTFPAIKAILIYGQPGVGKTAALHALASELNYELIELNASDTRNKRTIEETLLPASQQASIFGNKKLIVIDEIDGLSGTSDRGGASAVADIINQTNFPIVLTANDPFIQKLKKVRKVCKLIQFNPLQPNDIIERLKLIASKENLKYEEEALTKLAYAAQGDLRAAINDLEMLGEGKDPITKDMVQLWGRAQDENISNALKIIFKSDDSGAAFDAVDNLNEDYDMLRLWLDENLYKEYSGESIYRAYNCLSYSDIFNSRIRRWQHWRFLVYVRNLLVAGVQHSKDSVKKFPVSYQRPSLLLKLWIRSAREKKMKSEMEKFTEKLHSSTYRLKRDFLPYYSFIVERNKKMAEELSESFR